MIAQIAKPVAGIDVTPKSFADNSTQFKAFFDAALKAVNDSEPAGEKTEAKDLSWAQIAALYLNYEYTYVDGKDADDKDIVKICYSTDPNLDGKKAAISDKGIATADENSKFTLSISYKTEKNAEG